MVAIEVAAQEIKDALELPRGYTIIIERQHIVIGNDLLAFTISPEDIERGVHIEIAKYNFPRLLQAADRWLLYAEPGSYWMQ